MKKPLFILLLLAVVLSCKDDDVVPNRVIFTFTLKQPVSQDYWIVLRDNDSGDLIDSRQISKAETFESRKKIASGKMTVSFVRVSKTAPYGVYAQVFSDIDVGATWTYTDQGRNHIDPNLGYTDGDYSLTITNAPLFYSFAVSDKYGSTTNSYGTYSGGSITADPWFHDNVRQMITVEPAEGNQKYAFIDNLSQGKEVVVDYENDFKEFDKYIDLPIADEGYLSVMPYESTAEYYNSYEMYNSGFGEAYGVKKPTRTLGLLDQFPVYRISIGSYLEYDYLGPAPSQIVFPSRGEFTLTQTAIDKYDLETTADYNYSMVSYSYSPGSKETSFSIDYYAPKGQQSKHFDAVSDEMVTKYSIKKDPLNYFGTQITVGTRTYAKLQEFKFADQYDASQPYEISTFQVRPTN